MSFLQMRKFLFNRRTLFIIFILLIGAVLYFGFFHTLTISPLSEQAAMAKLAATKQHYPLTPFTTDGCSGGVSRSWTAAVHEFADLSDSFSDKYAHSTTIPFESACITHDQTYHRGEGGYRGRLQADNALRADILTYAMENTDEIKLRTGLETDAEVLFLYELIADSIYRGVRLGGAPCTGTSYAWGYGYNNGVCE